MMARLQRDSQKSARRHFYALLIHFLSSDLICEAHYQFIPHAAENPYLIMVVKLCILLFDAYVQKAQQLARCVVINCVCSYNYRTCIEPSALTDQGCSTFLRPTCLYFNVYVYRKQLWPNFFFSFIFTEVKHVQGPSSEQSESLLQRQSNTGPVGPHHQLT